MPVDLFGQPADYRALEPIVTREGLAAALRYRAGFRRDAGRPTNRRDRRCGGDEFLPGQTARLLRRWRRGFTNDDGLDELLRSIRIHGQGRDKYENVRIGVNSRLDTIQAAILIEKLKIFPDEIKMRESSGAAL